MKTCKNCKYWAVGHPGVWDTDNYGRCNLLNDQMDVLGLADIVPIVEGCVHVHDRTTDFEYVMGKDFGCIHFKKK